MSPFRLSDVFKGFVAMRVIYFCVRWVGEEGGQDLIEYALLAALISIVAVVAITSVGTKLLPTYEGIAASIP